MSVYNIPTAFRTKGKFDVAAFKKACGFLIQQYPILGAAIREENGIPYHVIESVGEISVHQETIGDLKEKEIDGCIKDKAKIPFSLETGPLMRVHLFSRTDHDHILLIVDATESLTVHDCLINGTA